MTGRRAGQTTQRGALLPALALALAGGGVLWLAAGLAGSAAPGAADAARSSLLAARRALLAHASAYPETYGPAGAGPGHLVCPDTDTPLESDAGATLAGARAGAAFRGDGPNPPCGGGTLAVGRLPRHVSPSGRRAAFHHERSQRLVYGVSTRYVNNPVDRVVNLARGEGTAAEIVAVIVDPGDVSLPAAALAAARDPRQLLERVRAAVARASGRRAASALPHVLLRRDELVAAAGRRVAAWFVETATTTARRRCAAREREGVDAEATRASAHVTLASSCVPVWPAADCVRDDALEPLRWLDESASAGCAVAGEPASGLPDAIENVPPARHWFVRNGWSRFVALRRDPACRDVGARCRLRTRRGDGTSLTLQLVPDADGSGVGGRRS